MGNPPNMLHMSGNSVVLSRQDAHKMPSLLKRAALYIPAVRVFSLHSVLPVVTLALPSSEDTLPGSDRRVVTLREVLFGARLPGGMGDSSGDSCWPWQPRRWLAQLRLLRCSGCFH